MGANLLTRAWVSIVVAVAVVGVFAPTVGQAAGGNYPNCGMLNASSSENTHGHKSYFAMIAKGGKEAKAASVSSASTSYSAASSGTYTASAVYTRSITLQKGAQVSESSADSYDQCSAGAIRLIKFNSSAIKEVTCLNVSACNSGTNNTGNVCVENTTSSGSDSTGSVTTSYYCVTRVVSGYGS